MPSMNFFHRDMRKNVITKWRKNQKILKRYQAILLLNLCKDAVKSIMQQEIQKY